MLFLTVDRRQATRASRHNDSSNLGKPKQSTIASIAQWILPIVFCFIDLLEKSLIITQDYPLLCQLGRRDKNINN